MHIRYTHDIIKLNYSAIERIVFVLSKMHTHRFILFKIPYDDFLDEYAAIIFAWLALHMQTLVICTYMYNVNIF